MACANLGLEGGCYANGARESRVSRHLSGPPSLTQAAQHHPSILSAQYSTSTLPAVFTHFFINVEKEPKVAGPVPVVQSTRS